MSDLGPLGILEKATVLGPALLEGAGLSHFEHELEAALVFLGLSQLEQALLLLEGGYLKSALSASFLPAEEPADT